MATNLLLLIVAIVATTAACTTLITIRQQLKGIIMTATQDAIDTVTAQLTVAHDSIVTAITDASAPPDLTGLQAAAQAIADIAPAPAE
jgi:hypothetical protein